MSLSFGVLWPLALLPFAVAIVVWARRSSLIEFHPRQVDLMTLLRGVALVLVILAMTQPVLHRSGSWLSLIYVLDVSQSVAPQAVQDAITWIEQVESMGGSEHSRFIAFGANTTTVASADALRRVRVADGPVRGAVDRSQTDVAAALEGAVASLPPHHVPRIVLLSDGNATHGDLNRAVEHLELRAVRVYPKPTAARFEGDTWIDSLTASATVRAGSPFDLHVDVYAQVPAQGRLLVMSGDEVLATEELQLQPGLTSLALLPVVDRAGSTTLDVVLQLDSDPKLDNNLAQVALQARERARVLYIEGVPRTSGFLADALSQGGFDVTVVSPLAMPINWTDFDDYELVIMSDVLPEMIRPETMEAIAYYVQERGGGFVLAGGESVYGEEGYAETRLEEVLPVWFKAEREPKDLVLVIALDKSYSMVGDKMALAKEASKAAARLLEDEQQFGLLAFDYHFYWPVPIQLARNKQSIEDRISSVEASSPTNIYPALQDVYTSLQTIDAEVKHVILLSDGKTYEDDYEGLVTRMREDDITVSTVAVGDKADRELLGSIADWGSGRSYFIADPTRVPEVFIDETQMAQGITIEEGDDVVPVVRKRIEVLSGLDMDEVPPLLGYVRTMPKDGAEIIIDTGEDGDPILARWQFGLGRALVFASDVKNRWSAPWLEWEGYGKFWSQLVRENLRQSDLSEPGLTVARTRGAATVSLDLVDGRGRFRNAVRPSVLVTVGDTEPRTVQLSQVAPGSYEARIGAAAEEPLTVSWAGDRNESAERRLLPGIDPELRYRAPDQALLRGLARATGGRYDATPDQLVATDGQTVERPLQLWPGLAAVALLLYLLNMLLRRVRLIGEAPEAGAI